MCDAREDSLVARIIVCLFWPAILFIWATFFCLRGARDDATATAFLRALEKSPLTGPLLIGVSVAGWALVIVLFHTWTYT